MEKKLLLKLFPSFTIHVICNENYLNLIRLITNKDMCFMLEKVKREEFFKNSKLHKTSVKYN